MSNIGFDEDYLKDYFSFDNVFSVNTLTLEYRLRFYLRGDYLCIAPIERNQLAKWTWRNIVDRYRVEWPYQEYRP